MAERLVGVSVVITGYLGDEPQPGIVACELTDAHGRLWEFVEKSAIVSAQRLDAQSTYPRTGLIACEIVSRHQDGSGGEIIRVDTEQPWSVASIDGTTRFDVLPASLREWERGESLG